MENKRTQTKVAMNYGALYGFSGIAVFLLFYFLGTDIQSKLPQVAGYVLLIVFIFMGIKSYRDEDLGGFIGYGTSLGTGVLISFFGGIISGAFTFVFNSYIAPDMMQKILEASQENMANSGMSEEQIEKAMTYSAQFMTPFWLVFFSVIGITILGFIFSLIISIFTKREQNPFNTNVG